MVCRDDSCLFAFGKNSKKFHYYSGTPLYGHPLSTDTLLLRTGFFVPGESPYIFSKFNWPNTDTRSCGQQTLVSWLMNRFS